MSLRVTDNYVKLNSDFKKLNIVGVLLGGSILYKHRELNDIDFASDWDGIILVKEKSDIVKLVNNFRNELCDLLEIEKEEYPELKVFSEEKNFNIYKCFDGVRFVGKTANKIKKGAKILSVDYFERILKENKPSHVNILSFKDVRVSVFKTNDNFKNYQIQQATCVDENLVILHEMDIFVNELYKKSGIYAAIFGATTDLLMTGAWVYDDDFHTGDKIVKELFFKFCQLHTSDLHGFPSFFKNQSRFHQLYCQNLKTRLNSYIANRNNNLLSIPFKSNCDGDPYYYWGKQANEEVLKYFVRKTNNFKMPEVVDINTFPPQQFTQYDRSTPFSSNCQYGYCEVKNRKLFWKQTKFLKDELAGSKLVLEHYCYTQLPEMIDDQNQIIFYPYFKGELLSNIRSKIAQQEFGYNLHEDLKLQSKLLTLELQRSEDILTAYRSSVKILADIQPRPLIHRFFYDRLINDSRLKEFYGAGLNLPNADYITIEELKNKNLIINGRSYGHLSQILEKAEELLNPENLYNKLVINGMGDSHSGNLLVESTQQRNSTYKYLYIDYEVAGWHSPILDLAKPFFIDVFFNLVYADLFTSENELFNRGIIQVEAEDKSALKIDLKLPESLLSYGIYEIKRRYLLLPFLEFIENHLKSQPNCNWSLVFGHALLTCAILTRNYSKRPDVFFATLALGVICADMKTFNENEEIFKMISDMKIISKKSLL